MAMKGLQEIGSISWQRVFDEWKRGEVWQKGWQDHWTERGFDSWDAWRGNYVTPLAPEAKTWHLYQITDLSVIADFYGVPVKEWAVKCYGNKTTMMLRDIIKTPIVQENDKVRAIEQNFPITTLLTGVVHDEQVVLVDGMHRSCALAQMAVTGALPVVSVTIALAKHGGALPILEKDETVIDDENRTL